MERHSRLTSDRFLGFRSGYLAVCLAWSRNPVPSSILILWLLEWASHIVLVPSSANGSILGRRFDELLDPPPGQGLLPRPHPVRRGPVVRSCANAEARQSVCSFWERQQILRRNEVGCFHQDSSSHFGNCIVNLFFTRKRADFSSICSLAYCELYVTVGTLFRRFPDLKVNELSAEDLAYDEYFSSYNRSRRSNSMSKSERRIHFLGPDDLAPFQGRSTLLRVEKSSPFSAEERSYILE